MCSTGSQESLWPSNPVSNIEVAQGLLGARDYSIEERRPITGAVVTIGKPERPDRGT